MRNEARAGYSINCAAAGQCADVAFLESSRMEQNLAQLNASKDRVVHNFQDLIAGAEDLLRSTANVTGEGVELARQNFRAYVDSAKGTLGDVEEMARERYRQASEHTDRYVRGNPWQAVGIAVAAGVLVGLFANRR
jgi:ElaB/YqjD/DUF883 family membrane-anchored ribosome-binding protein